MNNSFPINRISFPKNKSDEDLIANCSSTFTGGSSYPPAVSGNTYFPAVGGCSSNNLQVTGSWLPAKTAAGDFLKVQYTEVEVRCAITRKLLPAGSPVMLLGGMVISAEAFERWLEEQLSGMISRHQDLHTDNGPCDE